MEPSKNYQKQYQIDDFLEHIIKDESMLPFEPGWLVIGSLDAKIKSNDFVLVKTDNRLLFRQIWYYSGKIKLHPLNSSYEDILCAVSDIENCFKVVEIVVR